MRLVITLATRNRPQQVLETIKRNVENMVLASSLLEVQVDDDDTATIEALRAPGAVDFGRVALNVAPRPDTIAEKWNRALHLSADVYLTAADDDPFATSGYDNIILDAAKVFPDGFGMVYGDMANASFTGVTAFTAKWVEKLGYIFPPYFPYWFVDHWTDDVAKMTGRYVYAPVRTDQSKAGKTQEMREPGWWATWFDAAHYMRRKIARDIITADDFEDTSWQKQKLLRNMVFVEHRSRWVNDNVRANSETYERMSGLNKSDERYQRIRQRAVDMIPHLLDDFGMSPEDAYRYRNLLAPPTKVIGLARAWA